MNPVLQAIKQAAAKRKQAVDAVISAGAGTPARALAWQQAGRYFGYPPCCIESFIMDCCAESRAMFDGKTAPWDGTGFIPCAEHAKTITDRAAMREFARTVISPSRNPNADPFGPGAR